jgi:nicotinamide mononucleotide transporter
MDIIEVLAVVTGAASVWLLANNSPLGWWVGLVSVTAFGWVFFEVRLFAEVAIQAFYFVTSVQAIRLWLRGGATRTGIPVSRVPRRAVMITVPLVVVSTVLGMLLLQRIGGAAPFWDALTTVLSLTAHLWLVRRYAESWWIWVTVDVIYVPLYLSRGLALTSALYVAFLAMAVFGLLRFRRELEVAR